MTEREWVENEIGKEILAGMPDEVWHHFYRGMHDYGMGFYDADRWAWLNTLFGYDIGAERALSIITWYDDNGLDALDINAEDKETVENITRFELGFYFNFNGWPDETPETISYVWPYYLLNVGDRVRLIDVPDFAKDDLNRIGTVTKIQTYPGIHGRDTDVLLDGDDGNSGLYDLQLELIN